MTTSISGTRRRTTSWASGCFRSRVMPRLLRLSERNVRLSFGANSTEWRQGSPSGGSTLITSAPRSPRCIPANGAAIISENSRIFTPSRAPGISALLGVQGRGPLHPAQLHPHGDDDVARLVGGGGVVPGVLGLRAGPHGDHLAAHRVGGVAAERPVGEAQLDGPEQADGVGDVGSEVVAPVPNELDDGRGG